MLEGSVDKVTTENALGWLSDRRSPEKWDVVASLNGEIIGEAKAILSRPDLAEAGFGDGMCGFNVVYRHKLASRDLVSVTLSPKNSTLILPRTTKESYIDVVGSLTTTYPGAGRSRTIYGGLWTDRTDSLQLLASRAQAGTCPPGFSRNCVP